MAYQRGPRPCGFTACSRGTRLCKDHPCAAAASLHPTTGWSVALLLDKICAGVLLLWAFCLPWPLQLGVLLSLAISPSLIPSRSLSHTRARARVHKEGLSENLKVVAASHASTMLHRGLRLAGRTLRTAGVPGRSRSLAAQAAPRLRVSSSRARQFATQTKAPPRAQAQRQEAVEQQLGTKGPRPTGAPPIHEAEGRLAAHLRNDKMALAAKELAKMASSLQTTAAEAGQHAASLQLSFDTMCLLVRKFEEHGDSEGLKRCRFLDRGSLSNDEELEYIRVLMRALCRQNQMVDATKTLGLLEQMKQVQFRRHDSMRERRTFLFICHPTSCKQSELLTCSFTTGPCSGLRLHHRGLRAVAAPQSVCCDGKQA